VTLSAPAINRGSPVNELEGGASCCKLVRGFNAGRPASRLAERRAPPGLFSLGALPIAVDPVGGLKIQGRRRKKAAGARFLQTADGGCTGG